MRLGTLLAAVLLVALRGLALAHATLVSADPKAGSVLAASPERIRLVFSEQVEASTGRVSLMGAGGVRIRLTVAADPRDVSSIVATLAPDAEPLAAGPWRVVWRVVSADGHPIDGSYAFTVAPPGIAPAPAASATAAQPAPAVGDTSSVPPPDSMMEEMDAGPGPSMAGAPFWPSLLRGLGVGALMALAGLLWFLVRRPTDAPAPARARRVATWLAAVAPILLLLHFALWMVHTSPTGQLDRDWLDATIGTTGGRLEVARCALALLALWALALARRPALALGFATLALLASAAVGHAAAIHPGWSVPAKALHLLGGAVWLGGLARLLLRDRDESAESFRATAEQVSAAALVAVGVVGASGMLQALLVMPTGLASLGTPYGLIVLAKLAGLFVLVGFGAYHRYRVMPALAAGNDAPARRGMGGSVAMEIAAMAVVVLLGGWLGYVPTPHDMSGMPGMHDMSGMHEMQEMPAPHATPTPR